MAGVSGATSARSRMGEPAQGGGDREGLVISLNVDGLRLKARSVERVVHRIAQRAGASAVAVCLQETRQKEGSPAISIEGFELVARRDRSRRGKKGSGGGVAVYVREGVRARELERLKGGEELVQVWMEGGRGAMVLACGYLPPDRAMAKPGGFFKALEQSAAGAKQLGAAWVGGGDWNWRG